MWGSCRDPSFCSGPLSTVAPSTALSALIYGAMFHPGVPESRGQWSPGLCCLLSTCVLTPRPGPLQRTAKTPPRWPGLSQDTKATVLRKDSVPGGSRSQAG